MSDSTFVNGRLVRDRTPMALADAGRPAIFRTATPAEYERLVWERLMFDLLRVRNGRTEHERTRAMADVRELLREVSHLLELNPLVVDEVEQRARQERGGFRARTILISEPPPAPPVRKQQPPQPQPQREPQADTAFLMDPLGVVNGWVR
ncbi:hypothetical protein [Streptomyces hydrogenans]|uniref:hypothetical protein n=1 Tax=Streptomyces hydrogenans TaxID=1873719 RepID=UPI0035D9917D